MWGIKAKPSADTSTPFLRPELGLGIINNDYYDDSNDNIRTIYPASSFPSLLHLKNSTTNHTPSLKVSLGSVPLSPLLHDPTQQLVLPSQSKAWIQQLPEAPPSLRTSLFNSLLAGWFFPILPP